MSLTVLKQSAPTGVQVVGGVYAVSQIAGNGTTATVTQANHGYSSGDTVIIAGSSAGGLATGGGGAAITVVDSGTYTYANTTNSTVTGTITAQKINDANLGTIVSSSGIAAGAGYGGFFLEPVGPKTTGDSTANGQGWSFDLRLANVSNPSEYCQMAYSNSGNTLYVADAWYYFNSMAGSSQGFFNDVIGWNGNTGNFWNNYTFADTGVAVPIRQWFQLRVCSQQYTNGTRGSVPYQVMYRLAGSGYAASAWTVLASGTFTGLGVNGSTAGVWRLGGGGTNNTYFVGRFGMPTIATSNNASYAAFTAGSGDAYVAIPNQSEPPAASAHQWYWDPANTTGAASDANDGCKATTPMLTLARVNAKAANAGFLAPAVPWQTAVNGAASGTALSISQSAGALRQQYLDKTAVLTGDVLNILHTGGEFVLGGTVTIGVDGLTINGIYINPNGNCPQQWTATNFLAVAPSAWSVYSGNCYKSTGANAAAVLYQNRILLQSQSSIASVESTAGRYFNDGSGNLYVNTLGGTNPASDGNRYEVSLTSGGLGVDVVDLNGASYICKGIYGSGSAALSGGSIQKGYVFGVNNVLQVAHLTVFDTCTADFAGNHGFGNTASSVSNMRCVYVNCVSQRALQGASAFVDYTAAGSGSEADYYNCGTGMGTCILPGEARPTFANLAYLTHTAGSGTFASVTFTDCNFSTSAGISTQDSCTLVFNGGQIGSAGGTAANATYNGAWFTETALGSSGGAAVCNNCIFSNVAENYNSSGANATYNYCTIDLSNALQYGNAIGMNNNGNNSVTFNECLLICGGNALASNIASGDSIRTKNCEIQQTAGSYLYTNYHSSGNNLTLANAQSAGIDTGSAALSAPSVDAYTYIRTAQSSITSTISLSQDFTGLLWAQRQTIGAYEFVSSAGIANASSGGGGGGANVVDDPDGYFVR